MARTRSQKNSNYFQSNFHFSEWMQIRIKAKKLGIKIVKGKTGIKSVKELKKEIKEL